MVVRFCWVLFFLGGTVGPLFAQSLHQDLQQLVDAYQAPPQVNLKNEAPPTPINLRGEPEIKYLFAWAVRGYQNYLSSQDLPSCRFHPSCSRYGSQSVQTFGLFKGLLLTSDRLLRCNNFPGRKTDYPFNEQFLKFDDPLPPAPTNEHHDE